MDIQPDTPVFLLPPKGAEGYRYGTVVQVRRRPEGTPIYVMRFDEPVGRISDETKLYFHHEEQFWCQKGVIIRTENGPDGEVVSVLSRGKPRKEDNRRSDRVDSHLSGITAAVDGRPECLVFNVGPNGLAILANEVHQVGARVDVSLRWNAQVWEGRMFVRRESESPQGSTVFGLECSDGVDGEALKEGLRRIAATVTFQKGILAELMGSDTAPGN